MRKVAVPMRKGLRTGTKLARSTWRVSSKHGSARNGYIDDDVRVPRAEPLSAPEWAGDLRILWITAPSTGADEGRAPVISDNGHGKLFDRDAHYRATRGKPYRQLLLEELAVVFLLAG